MEHLSDIHTYYFLDPENKEAVKPISKIDCEIVELILNILERQGSKALYDVLSKWKLNPDQDIHDDLEEFLQSEALELEMKEGPGKDWFNNLLNKLKKAYITIGDISIESHKIFIISKSTIHNGSRTIYRITINDEKYLPDKTSSWYNNLNQDFFTEDLRDSKLVELRALLSNNTMCRFLN